MQVYHEELEIDLLQQGIDLLDYWRGTLTPRRLWLLIKFLPHTSHFIRAAEPDLAALAEWGPTEHLLAHLWDLLAAVNSDPKKEPPHLPRPADVINRAKTDNARRKALVEKYMARQKQLEGKGTANG